MHVYHYAAYERTAIGRLMGRHGTREEEVDRLMRGNVLIDLYRDFSTALRASIAAAGGSLEQNYIPHDAIVRAIAAGDATAAERAGHACMEHILIALTDSQDLTA